MINIPLDKIKERILEEKDITEDTLEKKIKEKLDQLSGLISEQGAAHIVANEMGVKLVQTSGRLEIGNIVAGLKNVETVGKVVRSYEVREFTTKDGRDGKVANFILGDDSGTIRCVCWNEMAPVVKKMDTGDVVHIKGGYARDNNGRAEIHINERADLKINPEGVKVDFDVDDVGPARKKLRDLEEGDDYVEVLATIVQVFEPRFFEVYSDTGKRIREDDDGTKDTEFSYVMNAVIDDGTDNVRTVFWRRQTQQLLGMEDEEIQKFRDDPADFEPVKNDMLGNIVKMKGNVKRNEGFDRLELVARYVERNPDPEDEIKALNREAEKVKGEPDKASGDEKEKARDKTDEESPESQGKETSADAGSDEGKGDKKEVKVKEKKKASVSKEALDAGMVEEEDFDPSGDSDDDIPSIDEL